MLQHNLYIYYNCTQKYTNTKLYSLELELWILVIFLYIIYITRYCATRYPHKPVHPHTPQGVVATHWPSWPSL